MAGKPYFKRLLLPGFLAFVQGWVGTESIDAKTPEYFARLIDKGNVTFVFYDPVREPRSHQGYTTFHYDVTYRSSYQYQWADRIDGRQLVIDVKISQVKCAVSNQVDLPSTLNHDRRWTNSLVRHEFDHVAMTLDPRVRLLIEDLCASTPKIVRTLPASTLVTDEFVGRIVHEVVDSRYQAVLQLLLANENDLDAQTQHGLRELPNRETYFRSLFTEPNLRKQRFPFLEEVRPLLRNKAYREAKLPYFFGG